MALVRLGSTKYSYIKMWGSHKISYLSDREDGSLRELSLDGGD
jgi:hypothetical protein